MTPKKGCVGVATPTHPFFSEVPLFQPEQLQVKNLT